MARTGRAFLGGLAGACCLAGVLHAAGPAASVAEAAKDGDRATVRALLEQGADVNLAEGDGMTALHWAASKGDVEVARLLVARGANVKAATRLGSFTPLHLAAQAGSAPIIALLAAHGADGRRGHADGRDAAHVRRRRRAIRSR